VILQAEYHLLDPQFLWLQNTF